MTRPPFNRSLDIHLYRRGPRKQNYSTAILFFLSDFVIPVDKTLVMPAYPEWQGFYSTASSRRYRKYARKSVSAMMDACQAHLALAGYEKGPPWK